MAVAAFKSSTRGKSLLNSSTRATTATKTQSATSDRETAKTDSTKKVLPRRSRSVSSFSRTELDDSTCSTSNDFLIKRDNPLFCPSNSLTGDLKSSELDEVSLQKSKALGAEEIRRGRSAVRNDDGGKHGSGIGRSLSRVDSGRRYRSVSRGPVSRGAAVNSEVCVCHYETIMKILFD